LSFNDSIIEHLKRKDVVGWLISRKYLTVDIALTEIEIPANVDFGAKVELRPTILICIVFTFQNF
jgi:hypothetical protein